MCRGDNKTCVVRLEHDDEDGEMVTANVVMDRDWTASDRPTSVCLRSVQQPTLESCV